MTPADTPADESGSIFDEHDFLNATTTEAGDTSYPKCPTGEWEALCEKILGVRSAKMKDGSERTLLDVQFKVTQEEARNETPGLADDQQLLLRDSFFLDFDGTGKNLDFGPGMNVRLNQLRAALRQNTGGETWNPRMIEGAGPLYVKVVHKDNPEDEDNPFVNITRYGEMR